MKRGHLYLFLFLSIFFFSFKQAPEKNAKVSVICPTYNRHNRHQNLYAAFKNQTYPDKELLILDDSDKLSPYFILINDPEVNYAHIPKRKSIGEKRNLLIEKAQGTFIAHFDDDDYYAPQYLETMIKSIGAADLIKLSKWLVWKECDGTLWEWDTRSFNPLHFKISGNKAGSRILKTTKYKRKLLDEWVEANIWGFGFSYVFRKSLWEECPFDDIDYGEDYDFVARAKKLHKSLIHIPDEDHLVLHTMHSRSSTSNIFPQYRLKTTKAIAYFGEGVKPWLTNENK